MNNWTLKQISDEIKVLEDLHHPGNEFSEDYIHNISKKLTNKEKAIIWQRIINLKILYKNKVMNYAKI